MLKLQLSSTKFIKNGSLRAGVTLHVSSESLLRQMMASEEEVSMLQHTSSELDQHRRMLMVQLEKKSELLSMANDQLDEKVLLNLKITLYEQHLMNKTLTFIVGVTFHCIMCTFVDFVIYFQEKTIRSFKLKVEDLEKTLV